MPAADADDDVAALPPPGGLPPGRALRELGRRFTASPFYAAASAAADAAWVAAALPPALPVFANLRAGAWHVRPPVGACRFKSTDGHAAARGDGKFSLHRLNLHVAAAAGAAGGAAIVDATRRGKTFPDALSRTAPTWAAVINRVVAAARRLPPAAAAAGGWHALRLPPWVPPSEAADLEGRVAGWADAVVAAGVDTTAVAAAVAAPLAPVWLSRRGGEVRWAGDGGDARRPTTPLWLVSASDPDATRGRVAGPGYDLTFDYTPGGGDDEESWAGGLTAARFWASADALLAAGAAGWADAVAALPPPPAAPADLAADAHSVCGTSLAVGAAGSAAAHAAAGAVVVHLGPHAAAAAAAAAPSYHHLPLRPRSHRHDLLAALSPAVDLASAALAGATPASVVVVADSPDGAAAVAVAAAVMLACFTPPPACAWVAPFGSRARRPGCGCPAPPPPTDRDTVRARVAAVAACVPGAAPSKDAVKAVCQWAAPPLGRRCVVCGGGEGGGT